jgi:uncharacterized protein (DUF736 family)
MIIGAAWIKESNGKKYFSCKLNFVPTGWDGSFAMFKNDKKESDNHPDYNMVYSERKKDDIPI